MQLNGSQILIECLLEQGVDTVFGYPGGTILNVYDELYNYAGRVQHIPGPVQHRTCDQLPCGVGQGPVKG